MMARVILHSLWFARVVRALVMVLLTLTVLIILLLVWLLRTEVGTMTLLNVADRSLDALTIEGVHGRLASKAYIDHLQWQDHTVNVSLDDLELTWGLFGALRGQLDVKSLAAKRIVLEVTPTGAGVDEAPAKAESQGVVLPTVTTPLSIVLRSLAVDQFIYRSGDTDIAINNIVLAANWRGSDIEIGKLGLESQGYPLSLMGKIDLNSDYPLSLKVELGEKNPFATSVIIAANGSLKKLALSAKSSGRYRLTLEGGVEPLSENVPFDVDLTMKELAAESLAKKLKLTLPPMSFSGAKLKAKGDLERVDATLKVDNFKSQYWAPATLATQLNWRGDSKRITLNRLSVKSDDGNVDLKGQVELVKGIAWELKGDVEKLVTDRYSEPYSGLINLSLQTKGHYLAPKQGDQLSFDLKLKTRDSVLNERPLDLVVDAKQSANGVLEFNALSLKEGDNHIEAKGTVNYLKPKMKATKLAVDMSLNNLAQLWPGLSGRGGGKLTVTGALAEPDVTADIDFSKIVYDDLIIDKVQLDGKLQLLAKRGQNNLRVKAAAIHIGKNVIKDSEINVTGNWAKHSISVVTSVMEAKDSHIVVKESEKKEPARQRLGVKLACGGGLTDKFAWQGQCRQLDLSHGLLTQLQNWRLRSPVKISVAASHDAVTVSPLCLDFVGSRSTAICSTAINFKQGVLLPVELNLNGVDLSQANDFVDKSVKLAGKVSFKAQLAMDKKAGLSVDAKLAVDRGRGRWHSDDGNHDFVADRFDAKLLVKNNHANFDLNLLSKAYGSLTMKADVSDLAKRRQLTGGLKINHLNFSPLMWLMPDIERFEGDTNANIDFSGTLEKPQLRGELTVANGRVSGRKFPVSIKDWQLMAKFDSSRASLTGSFLEEGEGGKTDYSGSLVWPNNKWQLAFNLKGDRIRVKLPPEIDLMLSPDLHLVARNHYLELTGNVDIPQAYIHIKDLPETAISESSDVVYINEDQEEQRSNWKYNIAVKLHLGDEVKFRGFGANLHFGGDLVARVGDRGVLNGVGEVRIVKGNYRAYGQDLTVRRGSFAFNGPITSPDIYLEAVRNITEGNVTVGLRVTGRPQRPKMRVFSEPSMDEDVAMLYLLTGHGSDTKADGNMLGGAALAMAIASASSQGTVGDIAKKLGISEFQLSTGAGDAGTEVQVSGYLRADLFVKYGMSVFDNVNTLTLRYKLRPKLYLEGVSGVTNAIDLLYSFESDY